MYEFPYKAGKTLGFNFLEFLSTVTRADNFEILV